MKRMTFTGIGLLLMAIGTVLADSECILIPIAFMTVGAAFALCGKKRGEQDEQNY